MIHLFRGLCLSREKSLCFPLKTNHICASKEGSGTEPSFSSTDERVLFRAMLPGEAWRT